MNFRRFIRLGISGSLMLVAGPSLLALPGGGKVERGNANIERSGNQLTVRQNSQNLVVNWKSFSIQNGETTRFVQPNSESAALNRVMGGSRSLIDGSLKANGKLILVNPNGITVGPNGMVDVRSFTASTQNLTTEEFIGGGEFLYKGDSDASIENLGVIRASGGDAILIAREIRNSGQMVASGLVGLAAGSEVRIKPAGEDRIFIQTDTRKTGKITQTREATIAAASAEIRATGNPDATEINLDGLIAVNEGSKKLIVKSDPGRAFASSTLAVKTFKSGGLENYTSSGGGAIVKVGDGTLDVTGSNTVSSGSGLIFLSNGTVLTGNQTINGNTSGLSMQGLSAENPVTLNITAGSLSNPLPQDRYFKIGNITYRVASGGSLEFAAGALINSHNAFIVP